MEGGTSIIEHFAVCLPSFWGLNSSSLKGIVTFYREGNGLQKGPANGPTLQNSKEME